MKLDENTIVQIISLVILIAIALFLDPREATTIGKMAFFALVLAIVMFLVVWDIYGKITKNKKYFQRINEKILIHKDIDKMNQKLSKLEGWKEAIEDKLLFVRNRRGNLDPRLILGIVVIVLIIIYLKSKG